MASVQEKLGDDNVSTERPTSELKQELPAQKSKESLSAFFTILAAAFGLISDGCEPLLIDD